jgi:5-methylcytosine-specific restriction endonuclease McrA
MKIGGRLSVCLRSAMRRIIEKRGYKKPPGSFRLLGYSPADLVKHIENCFGGGCVVCGGEISIDNPWHLAHLKPISCAKSPEDVLSLFQLENLSVAHPSCNIRIGATDLTTKTKKGEQKHGLLI